MNSILMVAVAGAGLGFILILYKLLKKGSKVASRFPASFSIFFLLYAILGLTGFMMTRQVTENILLISLLLLIISLAGGTLMAYNLYEKWEWSSEAGFGKKFFYLFGNMLTGMVAFAFVFLLCEHRGFGFTNLKNDLVWWLLGIIPTMLLPLLVKEAHSFWNKIPKLRQIKPVFELPLGSSPPFIETGETGISFQFIIPLDYRSKEVVKSKISVPLHKTLEEAFHYKVHEHNIVKRYVKNIVLAEENKRSKLYGWCFYRVQKIWWGWWIRKNYIDPKLKVGVNVSNGETIFVERLKLWEQ